MPGEAKRGNRALSRVFVQRHPAEVAQAVEASPANEASEYLQTLPMASALDVLRRVNSYTATQVLTAMEPMFAARLLEALTPHRAAALLARLPSSEAEPIFDRLESMRREELRALATYPSDTAGAIMDPRVNAFRPDTPVRDVIRQLRSLRVKRIFDVFVVDEEEHLLGAVALQDVVLAEPRQALGALVQGVPPSVQATASRLAVVEELQKTRAASIAVVDYDGRLLGVLRQSELLTATQQEATAELVTMVGASQDERALSRPLFSVRKRLPWLQINLLTAFLAASVVGLFESTIARFTALAVLLPVVAGQSGNTGAQALAVTMRGLSLRQVRAQQWLRVVLKEVAVGAVNGVAVAATTSLAVYVWSRSLGLALVIGVSMVISMVMAGIAGAAIPMVLTALRQDPAQSSSIILTTATDVVGFFSFLGIATLLSSML
jgi:magnesium transporter